MSLSLPSHCSDRRQRRFLPRRQAQRGVTLLFALVTLVVLLLATLALVRSVDTSTILMGNIAFKQDATATADQATRQAVTYLTAHSSVLNTDDTTNGYYASTQELKADGVTALPPVDVTGQQLASTNNRQLVDWDGDTCAYASSSSYATGGCAITAVAATAATGNPNSAKYVVFRLCSMAGDISLPSYPVNGGMCAKPLKSSTTSASKKGELNYADSERFTGASGPYYRIVVRVQGARNTTSFTETIVHLL